MNLVLNMEIGFGSKFIMPLRVAWKGADQGNLTFLSPRQNLLRMLGWAIWGERLASIKHCKQYYTISSEIGEENRQIDAAEQMQSSQHVPPRN